MKQKMKLKLRPITWYVVIQHGSFEDRETEKVKAVTNIEAMEQVYSRNIVGVYSARKIKKSELKYRIK